MTRKIGMIPPEYEQAIMDDLKAHKCLKHKREAIVTVPLGGQWFYLCDLCYNELSSTNQLDLRPELINPPS